MVERRLVLIAMLVIDLFGPFSKRSLKNAYVFFDDSTGLAGPTQADNGLSAGSLSYPH